MAKRKIRKIKRNTSVPRKQIREAVKRVQFKNRIELELEAFDKITETLKKSQLTKNQKHIVLMLIANELGITLF